ncbi:LysR family transcriptional regulator [Pluralibacter gergoviae]|uniref:LysR family transcriptional regulator n=1 Tax=Pluralibacter gergoviae TaxID=61647 RepID=UPI00290CB743|nr:LysR family transcriptional regulator [Pluralibacter gergoviae]MDU4003888.1 LysR family transcriptional regulator [Pluralibacter gergoviae]
MKDVDFNLIIALDALLTEASVAGAARRLGLSTSAMSRTLSRLRQATGDGLLVRAGRNMVLTPYAESVRARTREAVGQVADILTPPAPRVDLQILKRTFTLRANEGFVEALGPALIADIAARAPQVCLRFAPKPEKSGQPLREGRADLEIGVLSNMGPEIRVQALFRDRFVGVVRREHPLATQDSITPQDYVAWGHVTASRRGVQTGPVDEALAEMGLQRRIISVVPGFPAALAVAGATDLIALAPASFLINPLLAARFHRFELPVRTPVITISQMWHPRMENDPGHRWLRQRVLTSCAEALARAAGSA